MAKCELHKKVKVLRCPICLCNEVEGLRKEVSDLKEKIRKIYVLCK